ncbi:NAD(P)H-dependent glycerol-3-phosphate dehydrogenase [Flexibacterium corallicola]|uniref:NAD(P)H-dependent glycerol-3-phosphate dehydrogenase n=1 Tax=Flexibacterium corallicola TaxID=3037259 RepID=UPI00286F69C6|nr:NAD(P)H-dependent glycerol-3-phosphate dehydrogenase [Pseudovibrio sp. M1P-2-3]
MTEAFQNICVLGGGSWGTALALAAHRAERQTVLWARDENTARTIATTHQNPKYLPGITWNEDLLATASLSKALADAQAVLLVTPAQSTRQMLKAMKGLVREGTPLLLCAKGIEAETGLLLSDVVKQELPEVIAGALSGPSFAHDVASGLPTAVTIATPDIERTDALSQALASTSLRPYASDDLIGVQIGGALKNVLAIACGAAVGFGLGSSAQAALTTRGFAELTRLGVALGAKRETLTGLSGLGDLILTCSSTQSRNFSFGVELGKGKSATDLVAPGQKLAEGAYSAKIAVKLAAQHQIEMPIAQSISKVIAGELSVGRALSDLMTRPLKREAL